MNIAPNVSSISLTIPREASQSLDVSLEHNGSLNCRNENVIPTEIKEIKILIF